MQLIKGAEFLAKGGLVVVHAPQDRGENADVVAKKLRIAPHGDERAGDPVQINVLGDFSHGAALPAI
jgi:hypothetical protein